ncbi:hypothetical protein HX049_05950 [Myroides odoratimimus]|uniref:hypothetical protein n=1 Tax=Myroides odoratimimus TaxID=76832 RepID=UPI002575E3BE|nr:hypothetical protein [Myroides odoratimimus]MDM1396715.1 hypothetical protein [Myroides odoratimimus]
MDLDYESRFYIVWILSSIVIGVFGAILYKVIQDIKKKEVTKVQYIFAFISSFITALAFEWVLFYLAL